MKFRVTPHVSDDLKLTLTTERQDSISRTMREISRHVCDLKNEAVIQTLIKLGWTPPK